MNFLKILGLRSSSLSDRALNTYRRKVGRLRSATGPGFELIDYGGNHSAYREIQTAANRHKIEKVSVRRENLARLVEHMRETGPSISRVLCHGTRNGAEQRFFREILPDAEIVGTEISDTATQFPMTVEWDFHEQRPEWIGAFDLVFSNSWDHTYDPDKLFPVWLAQVASGGALALEWSSVHEAGATPIDPFRSSLENLAALLRKRGGSTFSEPAILDNLPYRSFETTHLVTRHA
jgi:hypothetical protein